MCMSIFIAIPGCIAYYSCMHTYGWSDVPLSSCSCVVWCGVWGCMGMRATQASKADVEAKENNGCTPLHNASQNGHDKVAQLLVVRDEGQGRGECLYM